MQGWENRLYSNRYSIAIVFTFCSSNALEPLLFWMSTLCLYFFFGAMRYSIILFVQVILSHFSEFKIIVGRSLSCFCWKFFLCQKKTQKKICNSKVALHIQCPSFVCKLPHECEDITKNALRTPLNAQCNIDYNILILYFFKLPSKSIVSLLFGELSNIDYFSTCFGIDSQTWSCVKLKMYCFKFGKVIIKWIW